MVGKNQIISQETFDKLFGIMIAVSAVVHVVLFATAILVPRMFHKPAPAPAIIEIDKLLTQLPKGPKIGTQAPIKNQTAAREPDHRKSVDIAKDNKREKSPMAMKQQKPKIKSKRLNYREREAQRAIERIKSLKNVKEGGGGTGDKSGGNIYAIYAAQIRRRLQNAWSLPPGLSSADKAKKVGVRVKIGASGAVTTYFVAKSSGVATLDRSAKAAVSAVGVFPKPPPLIAKQLVEQGIYVTFDPLTK